MTRLIFFFKRILSNQHSSTTSDWHSYWHSVVFNKSNIIKDVSHCEEKHNLNTELLKEIGIFFLPPFQKLNQTNEYIILLIWIGSGIFKWGQKKGEALKKGDHQCW